MTKLSTTPGIQLPPIPKPLAPKPLAAPISPGQATSGVSRPPPVPDPAKIAKSAHDFEAMAIGQLLQPMFDTVDSSHGLFGGGPGEEAWKPMLVQELAKQVEAHGGLGLAKPIYDAMLRMQETTPK